MKYDQLFKDPGYHSALLTTFSIDTRTFENIVLPSLRISGCRNIGVLADRDCLNQQLADLGGASRAGRAYQLSKVKVSGAFHPKIVLQLGRNRGRLVVGSGNLTGPGIISNLEAAATLTVTPEDSRAAPILAAALNYLEGHVAEDDQALREVILRARNWSPWLHDVAPAWEIDLDGRRVVFTSEAQGPIAETFRSFTGGDPIERLIFVSPYSDGDLSAVSRLREMLGSPPTALIVDDTEQDFTADIVRQHEALTVHGSLALSNVGHADTATQGEKAGLARRLHAKLLIAEGQEADYVLSGSANASRAALFSRYGGEGNAEACILTAEPKGTAADRLRLHLCLSELLPLDRLRPGNRGTRNESNPMPVDGGSMRFVDDRLLWTPPRSVDPAECRIAFVGYPSTLFGVPKRISSGWSVNLAEGVDPDRLSLVTVLMPEGVESAPIPVALLSKLAYEARPTARGEARRLLDQIGMSIDLDVHLVELAEKLIALQAREASAATRDARRSGAAVEHEAPGEILSEVAFGRIAEWRVTAATLAGQPLMDLRRIINRHLGLSPQLLEDDLDDLEGEALSISDDVVRDGAARVRPLDPAGEEGPRRAVKAASRSQASALADRLRKTGQALRQGSHPAEYVNCIRLHMLINAVLILAAPVGSPATDKRPFDATNQKQGWVRGLGAVLDAIAKGMQVRRDPSSETGQASEAEVRLDMFATAVFAARLSLEAATEAGMDKMVIRKLQNITADLVRVLNVEIGEADGSMRRVTRRIDALQAKHGHLALKTKAAAKPEAQHVAV